MSISEEDFKKMFDLVRELHENYTKNIERENENLRIMLADAQKKLDDALAAIEKLKKGSNEDTLKKYKEIQDKMQESGKIWTTPPPYPYPYPSHPTVTWHYTTNTTQPYALGGVASSTTDGTPMNKAYDDFRKQYMSSKLHAKVEEDG